MAQSMKELEILIGQTGENNSLRKSGTVSEIRYEVIKNNNR